MMSVSQKSIDSIKNLSDLVKEGAINICENKVWSCFICVLELASMASHKINCYYPDIGSIRYRTMFNPNIQSRILQMLVEDIHIMFSYEGLLRSSNFQHSHCVPIIFHAGKKPALKRKDLNFNRKGEKKLKKTDLNSQNTQKTLLFPKVFEKHSSKNSIYLPRNQSELLKNRQSKLPFRKYEPKMKIQSSLSYN